MQITIDDNERELLLEVLTDRLGMLREQVHHSRTYSFTDKLKEIEKVLKDLFQKLTQAQ